MIRLRQNAPNRYNFITKTVIKRNVVAGGADVVTAGRQLRLPRASSEDIKNAATVSRVGVLPHRC